MSTRAIIGILNKDGTITGGWQWNDGKGLLPALKRHFDTLEKVKSLISNGVWNNMVLPLDKETLERYTAWTKREENDYYIVPVGKCHLLKERPNDNAEFCFSGDDGIIINADGSMTFADLECANGQDVNYLYLFHPETREWNIYQ